MRKAVILAGALALGACATTSDTSGGSGTSARGADECGGASYYADSLAGNSTASGEAYSPSKRTAAHKTLPFGTVLRVVRRDTGEETEVTVNDRGPFVSGRVIDLSRKAASDIDLITDGVADVCIYVK
jgi:rare lipoprotein A